MAIITALEPQKNKDRLNLFLDGEFACGLTRFAAALSGLKPGQEIDGDKLKEIIARSECDSAVQRGMKYLSLKPCTAKKMTEYLLGKGFEESAAEYAVERLQDLRLLNDAAYAEMYVKCFREKQGNGLIKHKLRGLGVDQEIINDALTDESEAAKIAARKYLRTHKKPDKQKLYAYLFNKGFSSESVRGALSVLDDFAADEQSEDFLD